MIKKTLFGALLMASVFLYGCYPQGAETLDDTNLVLTDYDDSFDFVSERTCYIVPQVFYIDSNATPNPQTDAWILDEIRKQFIKIGYTVQVDSLENPDDVTLVVLASTIKITTTSTGWYPGWGGWYGGWWGGYPGYGGCCYGGVPYSYSYDTGTIFIDAFDGHTPPIVEGGLPPSPWLATMNGVLGSTSIGIESRIRSVIAQAFTQSPYL